MNCRNRKNKVELRKQQPDEWCKLELRLCCGNETCDGFVRGVDVLCEVCEARFLEQLRAAGLRPELAN